MTIRSQVNGEKSAIIKVSGGRERGAFFELERSVTNWLQEGVRIYERKQ